ncbi:MAG TPA: hypothetical protein VLC46_18820 [Thermoanaerobaculia bacterium]|nr:hypothetical protein [Thermoanaerobaculia bacterium]
MKHALVAVVVCLVSVVSAMAQWYNVGPVGIGVTSTPYTLEVSGSTNPDIALSLSGTHKLLIGVPTTNGNFITGSIAYSDVAFREDGGGKILFSTSASGATNDLTLSGGNVGIGTASPGMILTVAGSGQMFGVDNRAIFTAKNSTGGYESYLWPRWSDNIMYLNYGSSGFNIRTNSSANAMFMDGTGQVSIGTTTPGSKLDVNGSSRFGYDFLTMPPPLYGGIQIGEYGAGGEGELQFLTCGCGTGYGFRFRGDSSNGSSLRLERRQNSTTWSDFMFFTPDGRLGIGTGSSVPLQNLVVLGPSDTTFPNSPATASVGSTSAYSDPNNGAGLFFSAIYKSDGSRTIIGAVSAIKESVVDGQDGGSLTFGTRANGSAAVSMERMRIDSGGNVGIGLTAAPGNKLDVNGNVHVSGSITGASVINATYQDVAEWVPASGNVPPGTVVVLNRERNNEVIPSTHAYDPAVAGVVSPNPGLILGSEGASKAKVATTGRVRVRVDASKDAIHIGDLLVTSDKPGVAMVSELLDLGGVKIHRPGTLIGKALEPLPNGEGEILVLLSLQ